MTLIERIRLTGLVQEKFTEYLEMLEHYHAMQVQNGHTVKPMNDESLLSDFGYWLTKEEYE